MLARQDSLEAFFDQPLAGAVDRRRADIQSFHDAAVAPALARRGNVGLEETPCLQDEGGGGLASRGSGLRASVVLLRSDAPHIF